MVPARRQQPNRHENLAVSTKGTVPNKTLVSQRAPEQARSGSTLLGLHFQFNDVYLAFTREY